MRVQGSDLKSVTELGSNASRLIHDDQIYVTGNSLNKTLKDAITDGSIAPSALSTIVTASGTTYSMTSTASESIINHIQTATCTYQLPAAVAGKRFVFKHSGYRADAVTFTNEIRIQPNTGNQIRWRNNMTINPGYISISKPGVTLTLIAIDTVTWVVSRLAYENHEKNSAAMGQNVDDVSLVGRNSWVTKKFLSENKQSPCTFSLNGYGYAAGGFGDGSWRYTLEKYNDNTNLWSVMNPLATNRYDGAGFSLNGYGYAAGGDTSPSHNYTATAERYNDATGLWGSVGSILTARAGEPSCWSLNGYGYINHGYLGSPGNYGERFNDTLNSWLQMASSSVAKWGVGNGFALNGYGYSPCGTTGSVTSDVQQYNDSGNFWLNRAGAGTARQSTTGLNINGYGYSSSGQGGGQTENSQYNDSINFWSTMAAVPTSFGYRRGISLNGMGYSCGGAVGSNYYSEVLQYN